jgi:hypothetical protein
MVRSFVHARRGRSLLAVDWPGRALVVAPMFIGKENEMAFWNRQAALDATHEAIAATCKTILVRTIDQLDVARSD